MRPIVTDGVAWSVCRSVTVVSHAKMNEPIEMPFGLRIRVGKRNHVLDGGPDLHWNGHFLGERGGPLQSIGTLVVGFHGLTRISPKNFHLTSILPLF